MRFLRILPAVWPRISWLFSRRTRNMALGSNSTTWPRISRSSSLAIHPLGLDIAKRRRFNGWPLKREAGGGLGRADRRSTSGLIMFVEEGLHRLQHPHAARFEQQIVGLAWYFDIFE